MQAYSIQHECFLRLSNRLGIVVCLPGLLKVFQGHVAFLLRHPCGAPVIDALYDRADTRQRDAMAAEFYGKEYTVLTQACPSLAAWSSHGCCRQADAQDEDADCIFGAGLSIATAAACNVCLPGHTGAVLADRRPYRSAAALSAPLPQCFCCAMQGPAPTSLQQVLKMADAPKQRQILQRLALHLTPLMEKGMVDAVLTHRCCLQAAVSCSVSLCQADAFMSLLWYQYQQCRLQ